MVAFGRHPSFRLILIAVALLGQQRIGRADIFGGVEIGAKGIRVITVDLPDARADAKVAVVDNKNTTLVANLADTKQFAARSVDETTTIVSKAVQRLRDELKIPDKRVFIVGSSGLFVPLGGDDKSIEVNKTKLAEAVFAATKLKMDFVTIEREAELTVMSVIPRSGQKTSVLVDIGSGNTKGGLVDDGGVVTFGIPFGTITLFDLAKKRSGTESFAAAVIDLRIRSVEPKLAESLAGKKELVTRTRVYLAGGAAWALTTYTKPADRGDFVAIAPSDLTAFSKLLANNPEALPEPRIPESANEFAKKAALKDIEGVRKAFTREQLVAGSEILKAVSDAFSFDAPGRQIFFARNAYIGWLQGYTVEKAIASSR